MSEHLQKMAGAGFSQFQVHQRLNRGASKEFLKSFLGAAFVGTIDELRHIRPGPFAELWILRVKVSLRKLAAQSGRHSWLGGAFLPRRGFLCPGSRAPLCWYSGRRKCLEPDWIGGKGGICPAWSGFSGLCRKLPDFPRPPLQGSGGVLPFLCLPSDELWFPPPKRDTFRDTCPKNGLFGATPKTRTLYLSGFAGD